MVVLAGARTLCISYTTPVTTCETSPYLLFRDFGIVIIQRTNSRKMVYGARILRDASNDLQLPDSTGSHHAKNAVEHDNHTSNQNVCEDNAHEVSFGYEVCETEDVWRCACNGDLGETISQVCRDGVWLNHHLSPVDCSQCNAETSEGCRSGTTRNPDDVIAASETCGDSTLEMSETGEQCDAIDDGAWRCACSANIGDVVKVCRDGQWTNYRVSPQDCGACNGEYSEGCEP